MHLVIFFTNPDRLSDIGVLFPWNVDTCMYPFRLIPDNHSIEQQVWIAYDEMPFEAFIQQLEVIPHLEEVYYVYHTHPLRDNFLGPLKAYLNHRRIFSKGLKAQHSPNTKTIFEELGRLTPSFSSTDFTRIIERIQPCNEHVSRIFNKLNNVLKMQDYKVNPTEFPGWVRSIYGGVMATADHENFEQQKILLKSELERYCQELSLTERVLIKLLI